MRDAITHDLTRPGWGNDYTFNTSDEGMTGRMMGWKLGIKAGDFLILRNGMETTRYQVVDVRYFEDPPDMFKCSVRFSPRR